METLDELYAALGRDLNGLTARIQGLQSTLSGNVNVEHSVTVDTTGIEMKAAQLETSLAAVDIKVKAFAQLVSDSELNGQRLAELLPEFQTIRDQLSAVVSNLEGLAESVGTELAEVIQKSSADLTTGLGNVIDVAMSGLQVKLDEASSDFSDSISDSLESMKDDLSSKMASVISDMTSSAGEIVNNFSASVGSLSEGLQSTATSISTTLQNTSQKMKNDLSDQLDKTISTVGDLTDKLDDFRDLLDELQGTNNDVILSTAGLKKEVQTLQAVNIELIDTRNRLNEIPVQIAALKSSTESLQQNILSSFESMSASFSTQVSGMINTCQSALSALSVQIKAANNTHLEAITTVIESLKTSLAVHQTNIQDSIDIEVAKLLAATQEVTDATTKAANNANYAISAAQMLDNNLATSQKVIDKMNSMMNATRTVGTEITQANEKLNTLLMSLGAKVNTDQTDKVIDRAAILANTGANVVQAVAAVKSSSKPAAKSSEFDAL